MLASWFVACLQYLSGERTALGHTVERLIALGTEHGFDTWMDSALVLTPLLRGERPGRDVLAAMHGRLRETQAAMWRKVFGFCVLAELYAEAGYPDEGRRVLSDIGEAHRHAFLGPEVYRLEAELLLRSASPAIGEAERLLITGMELARTRGEKSLELRAAMSLARLWQYGKKREAARRTLASVYDWFTEGADTHDLQEARRLLAELEM
jgi:hypothetical protein